MGRSRVERIRVTARVLLSVSLFGFVVGSAGMAWAGGNGNAASNSGGQSASASAGNGNGPGNPSANAGSGNPNSPGNPSASRGEGNPNPGNAPANPSANPGNGNPNPGKPAARPAGNGRGDTSTARRGASAQGPGRLPGGGRENNRGDGSANNAATDQPRGQDTSLAPPGSNGHILADTDGCTVNVGFYGFDTGLSSVTVVATEEPPTGRDTILHTASWTADYAPRLSGNTLQDSTSFTLTGEHHLKITALVVGADGHETRKTKVEWVRCANTAAAAFAPFTSADLRLPPPVLPAVLPDTADSRAITASTSGDWTRLNPGRALNFMRAPSFPRASAAGAAFTRGTPGPARFIPAPSVRGVAIENTVAAPATPAVTELAAAAPSRGARVLGTSFEPDSRRFAFTGADLLKLLLLAIVGVFFGWRLRQAANATT